MSNADPSQSVMEPVRAIEEDVETALRLRKVTHEPNA